METYGATFGWRCKREGIGHSPRRKSKAMPLLRISPTAAPRKKPKQAMTSPMKMPEKGVGSHIRGLGELTDLYHERQKMYDAFMENTHTLIITMMQSVASHRASVELCQNPFGQIRKHLVTGYCDADFCERDQGLFTISPISSATRWNQPLRSAIWCSTAIWSVTPI